VVADDPGRLGGRHAMARRLLSGLPDQPRDRHTDHRPPPDGVRGQSRIGAQVFVVPRLGAYAEDHGAIRPATGEARARNALTCSAAHPPTSRKLICLLREDGGGNEISFCCRGCIYWTWPS
jgi:hypothetical protein